MGKLIELYHRLPYPLRVAAASARGSYLRWWRYTPQTEDLVAAALERETWSTARWQHWQQERLAFLLHRAATKVPYYREHWTRRRRQGDHAAWDVLENWPLLTKDILRAEPHAFVADDCDLRQMWHEHTSGTTGKPLSLWQSRETVRAWYALFEARIRIWNYVSRDDRWGMLGGQLVAPFTQTSPPFWVWNAGLNQLYLSSYHLAPEHIAAYLDALRHYRITYMWGYASSLYALARVALERGLDVPQMRVAFSNAEPLYEHQRHVIAEAFRCPMRNTYGMSEIVCGASECAVGTLHLWPEAGIIEVLDDRGDVPLAAGQVGRLICTGLLNADMPLIRYEVGDRGALAPPERGCICGRTLPILQQVEGRMDDVVLTRDGRPIGRLDPVFKQDMPIHEAQIIQESLECIRVRFVPTAAYTEHDGQLLVARLRERVGEMHVELEQVEQIPRTSNGKFRAVISHVTQAGQHGAALEAAPASQER
jgi:phenylacetate-CoA ligase